MTDPKADLVKRATEVARESAMEAVLGKVGTLVLAPFKGFNWLVFQQGVQATQYLADPRVPIVFKPFFMIGMALELLFGGDFVWLVHTFVPGSMTLIAGEIMVISGLMFVFWFWNLFCYAWINFLYKPVAWLWAKITGNRVQKRDPSRAGSPEFVDSE